MYFQLVNSAYPFLKDFIALGMTMGLLDLSGFIFRIGCDKDVRWSSREWLVLNGSMMRVVKRMSVRRVHIWIHFELNRTNSEQQARGLEFHNKSGYGLRHSDARYWNGSCNKGEFCVGFQEDRTPPALVP